MILADTAIVAARERGEIVIEPFDAANLGGNSYDVRLGGILRVYSTFWNHQVASKNHEFDQGYLFNVLREVTRYRILDCAHPSVTVDVVIPEEGLVLLPGIMYLGSTIEYTETHKHVSYFDGRSSAGRLGISVHATAGRGDVGFCNHWTAEITVSEPVRIYAGMKIGQLTYHTVEGTVERGYGSKQGGTYGKLERDPLPQPSRMYTQFQK